MEKAEYIKLLEKSHVSEIFKAEKSYFLLDRISQNAHEINQLHNGQFKTLFGHFQDVLLKDVVLCLSKIYDKPSKKFPTLCFESLLAKMKEDADKLPSVSENRYFQEELVRAGMPLKNVYELVEKKNSPAAVVNAVAHFFYEKIKSDEFSIKIESLKVLRDKKIAHNENIEAIENPPTWKDLLELIEVAKCFVGVVGCFFNRTYSINGEYVLTEDSKRVSFALEKLFIELKNVENI